MLGEVHKMENLTIESLARAIHEDHVKACKIVANVAPILSLRDPQQCENFDKLPEWTKLVRLNQAKLMLRRIMR